MGDTLLSMLRFVCGLIDSVVYILISKLYDLFIDTSNIILYSQDAMDAIGKRIGLILGIFMLFRLAISLMSYLIAPDTISDKAKGGSKLVKNIIISLILLVTINPIFEQAYKIQIKLVESKFVEKIFFGPQASIPEVDIAYSLYSSFLTPSPEECKELLDPYVGLNTSCSNIISAISNHKIIDTFKYVIDNHRLNTILANYDVINYKVNGNYFFDYFMIVSTIAGVVVSLMLITFCMDVATRAIKLLFLQIIAPIPIIANVDPSKGSDIFKKWYKECLTTYISVFIRLIAINFAVFMMTLIQSEFHDVFASRGPLMTVLIIIGCLMFAKQVPKLIENITGLKSEGFTLNPIKKFQEQALFGKNITGFAAGTAGGLIGGFTGAGMGSVITGGLGGAIHGKGFTETWKNKSASNARMRTARLNHSTFGGRMHQRVSDVLGTGGELATIEREKHEIQDQLDRIDRDIKAHEDAKAAIKGSNEYRIRQEHMQQHNDVINAANKFKQRAVDQVNSGVGAAGARYQEMQRISKGISGSSSATGSVTASDGTVYRWSSEAERGIIAERIAQEAETYKNTAGWREYANEVANIDDINNALYDAKLRNARNEFDEAFEVIGGDIDHAAADYGNQMNTALNNSINDVSTLQVQGSDDERRIADIDRTISDLNGQKQPHNDRMREISRRETIANANKSAVGK